MLNSILLKKREEEDKQVDDELLLNQDKPASYVDGYHGTPKHSYDAMIREPSGVDAQSPSKLMRFSSQEVLSSKAKLGRASSETVLTLSRD